MGKAKSKIPPRSEDQKPITAFFKPSPEGVQKKRAKNRTWTTTLSFFVRVNKPFEYFRKKDYPVVRANAKRFISPECDAKKTWHGYAFVASNNFSEYDVITLIPRLNLFTFDVIPAGAKAGEATIDEDSALTGIYIKKNFRRAGLGLELVRFINKCDAQFHVYGGTEHNSRYRLSNEGAALVNTCIAKGILSSEQFIESVPVSPECRM